MHAYMKIVPPGGSEIRKVLQHLQVDAQEVGVLLHRRQAYLHSHALPIKSFTTQLVFAAANTAFVLLDDFGDLRIKRVLHIGRERAERGIWT